MGVYDEKPWLALYGDKPAEIEPEFTSGLAMFQAAVERRRRPHRRPVLRHLIDLRRRGPTQRRPGAGAEGPGCRARRPGGRVPAERPAVPGHDGRGLEAGRRPGVGQPDVQGPRAGHAAQRLRLKGARLPRVALPLGGGRGGGGRPGARGDHHLRARLRRRRCARAAGRLAARSALRHARPARAGRAPRGRAARRGRARGRRHRVPHLHVGHHRPAQGRDEHPRATSPSTPRSTATGSALGDGDVMPRRRAAVPHHRAGRPHRGVRC